MTQKREAMSAPGLLETYAQVFDPLFARWSQREGFRRYLEGVLMPAERNKTLTGLVNTAPCELATTFIDRCFIPVRLGQEPLQALRPGFLRTAARRSVDKPCERFVALCWHQHAF